MADLDKMFQKVPPRVATKARAVIRRLEGGEHFVQLGGKRLWESGTISIPVGRRYRLVARETEVGFEICKLLSHADYSCQHKRTVS